MNPFDKLKSELKRLETGYREESYYRSLCEFLEAYGSGKEYLHMLNISATSNPNSESIGEGIGFPDIEVRQNRRLVGYVEVKTPDENIDNPAYSTQFIKYRESLENVIFTNFKKWILYTWDKDGKPQKTEEAEWDYHQDLGTEQLKKLLTIFFEGQSYQAKTPHQLAIALARKTRLLSQQVEEALIAKNPDKKLVDLKKTFEKTLIQDISDHQFANIFAETIAYSLFLAKLEHYEKGSNEDFSLRTAVDFLPKNVPIFKDLYQLTGGRVEPITQGIYKATEILIEQLNFADIERIYKKLVEHKPGEDPVIQFYEPFLSEYDPEERKARGVYYTPKPVVDYIVRCVDHILKNKFDKKKGLGDESVQVLDPATGTGTFLMSVIQNIYADIEKENKPLGEEAIKRKFKDVVSNHILKHLYGFELLVAPYAIAHLKLTLELERLGFNFSMTEDDQDKENDRLKIFLANTLDDPNQPPHSLFGFESITDESEKARLVKKNEPILVITGNPPYSNYGQMNQGDWILNLLQDYKKDLIEKKINLDDDFIKFIRFAQWKLEHTGQGIFAMITSSTFIDGITHRQMRKSLLETFDEIYIYNLHGNIRRNEVAPNGIDDENVFQIMTGVSINFFIKYPEKKLETIVKSSELWGTRSKKFEVLLDEEFNNTKWQTVNYLEFNDKFRNTVWGKKFGSDLNFFVHKGLDAIIEYGNFWGISDIFPEKGLGLKTERDNLTIHFSKMDLENVINDFRNLDENSLRIKYGLGSDSRDWKINYAKKDLHEHMEDENYISEFNYRQFDTRYIWYSGKTRGFIGTPGFAMMRQFQNKMNLGLISSRTVYGSESWQDIFVTSKMFEFGIMASRPGNSAPVFPLYLYEQKSSQISLLGVGSGMASRVNISSEFIKEFSGKLGLVFVETGQGDLENNFGPEDVFYYTYAVFHSPTYRTRYAELLKIDFPRVPLTKNKELFKKLIKKGNELVNLHLLGENPFDKTETIFDDTSKWGVRIDGNKPEDIDDWKIVAISYDEKTKRIFVNSGQYFEGIEKEVWEFMVGGYQVLEKWLKDRKKAGRTLSYEDQIQYIKISVSLRESLRIMKEIDEIIPKWPLE
ncbi:MAG: N-6 DNA methylase [Microgenomates group bacterium Gr01-1014_5]|nr:MAG: N-6 DNA methylase [Microgenomates group bacterium Gr01-1014_5]